MIFHAAVRVLVRFESEQMQPCCRIGVRAETR